MIKLMKKFVTILACLLSIIVLIFNLTAVIHAEDKPPPGRSFPRLSKTPNDPVLTNSHVYPFWGPICQRYTYSVIYQDKENRPPEYVRIYFNGDWIDIDKENPEDVDYKKGVKYFYKFVPKKIASNFYFFEASNGLGKARDGIIDSPDNGPVLFKSAFDNNEIALIDATSGKKIWSYPTGKEWIGGVALSDNGKYLAVKTSRHIYFFETKSSKPKWSYKSQAVNPIGGDVKGGIDMSSDGSRIFASIGDNVLLFSSKSNQPLWKTKTNGSCYNAAISANGKFMAVANAGEEENLNTNLLIVWSAESNKPLWKYHSSGNFHDVSFSNDGSLIAAATGCPDRRGYIFSKNSNKPLWKSEMLTRDSPIHQAKITADGQFAVFGAESDDGALHLFSKEEDKTLWKFATPNRDSFRAASITPDGKYIGGSTNTTGQAFIFAKESATPLASWDIGASMGAVDLSNDGSFLVVGGTDSRVHIFERESKKERATISLNEFVGEIDVSGDGRYIAAGTSGSVYFFEGIDINEPEALCKTITEPEPEQSFDIQTSTYGNNKDQSGSNYCSDGICEGPETIDNCPQDCDLKYMGNIKQDEKEIQLPEMIFIFGFIASLITLGGYIIIIKFKLFQKPNLTNKNIGVKINNKVIICIVIVIMLFLILTITSILINKQILNLDFNQDKADFTL